MHLSLAQRECHPCPPASAPGQQPRGKCGGAGATLARLWCLLIASRPACSLQVSVALPAPVESVTASLAMPSVEARPACFWLPYVNC